MPVVGGGDYAGGGGGGSDSDDDGGLAMGEGDNAAMRISLSQLRKARKDVWKTTRSKKAAFASSQ